jgi:hypothetical protein
MIGVGIVTYDREKKFSEAYDAIDYSLIDKTFHVKDGGKPPYSDSERYENLWELDENKGVGFCKNLIIDNLLNWDCEHNFILEDDCRVTDNNVWKYCIDFAKHTGLLHFNWNNYRSEDTRHTLVKFPKCDALMSYNVDANFSYFNREFLKNIRFDENYINAWEHVDVEYQGIIQGFLPAFRMFVSPAYLNHYLRTDDGGESTIVGRPLHHERIIEGFHYWGKKWGKNISEIDTLPMEEFKVNMKEITKKYAQR